MLSGKAANTNLIVTVFGLTRPGIEPTTFSTRGGRYLLDAQLLITYEFCRGVGQTIDEKQNAPPMLFSALKLNHH